jgi:hypothetical protein
MFLKVGTFFNASKFITFDNKCTVLILSLKKDYLSLSLGKFRTEHLHKIHHITPNLNLDLFSGQCTFSLLLQQEILQWCLFGTLPFHYIDYK